MLAAALFLATTGAARAAIPEHLVEAVPTFSGEIPFKFYSGYLTVTGPFETEILLPSVADVDPDIDPLVVGVATGSTAVAVTGPDGPVADARLVARSAFEEREIPLDPTGAAESVLPAGSWLLRAEAPGFGGQEATLEVEDGQRTLERA